MKQFKIGQAAKLTGLCVKCVRYYEQRGLIPFPPAYTPVARSILKPLLNNYVLLVAKTSFRTLLMAADEALYQAKDQGRNRFCVAE